MFGGLKEFVWTRSSQYEIVDPCEFKASSGQLWKFGRRIITTVEADTEYRPLNDYPNLFRAFANVRDEEALLSFVKQYGPLTDEGRTPSSKDPHFTSKVIMIDGKRFAEIVYVPGDQIDHCLKQAAWCGHILRHHRQASPRMQEMIKELEVRPSICMMDVEADPVEGVRMILRPSSLLDAIKFQLLASIRSGNTSVECTHCENWFSKKRGAKFCSDKCKDDYHNARRKARR